MNGSKLLTDRATSQFSSLAFISMISGAAALFACSSSEQASPGAQAAAGSVAVQAGAPASAGSRATGGGGASSAGGGGQSANAGAAGAPVNEPQFDASHLNATGDSGPALCHLSDDRRSLLVTVANQGTTATGPTVVRVASDGAAFDVRSDTPDLPAGMSTVLTFDRGALGGFTPDWAFSVVVDPDGKHGAAHAPLKGTCSDFRTRAAANMVPLNARYDVPSGLWDKNAWWTGANMLEASIDYMRETGDPTYAALIDNTFVKNKSQNFLNDYYDDEGWWALVWIKAFDLTHDVKYLDMAKTIFKDMTGAWSNDCGGGLFWSKKRSYKNAIPNELFLTAAARLHERTPGDAGAGSFIDWAQRDWAWFKSSGMLRADNLIVDGLNLSNCQITGPTYTYNQGVILGALTDLSRITNDPAPLASAEAIAHATMTKMVDSNGTFIEIACNPKCGDGDGEQFKGVFTRNLAYLYQQSPRPEYRAFLIKQSDALWTLDRSAKNEFGILWQGPFDKLTSSRQSSALDALNGALITANMNLALGAKFTGSAACSADQAAALAGDGSSRWASKWCSPGASGQTLDVDLGAARNIVGFRVRHAGAGGEASPLNTRDFEIQLSSDGTSYAPVVTVTANVADVTTHPIAAQTARYARLHITAAQSATDTPSARIYEFEVFGITK